MSFAGLWISCATAGGVDGAQQAQDRAVKFVVGHTLSLYHGTAQRKAFALTAACDEARAIREEVGFFQAIRAALVKSVPGDGKRSAAERELAIQQIISPRRRPPRSSTS
jgi:hypothetical protein